MMKKISQLQNDNQGFTLVELMIVVAIIGILAAIAIPQFAAYRIRGFNSSAQSDVRNLNTTNAAFFADWQMYGITEQAAALPGAGGTGAGAAATMATTGPVSIPVITATTAAGAQGLQIPVGNGVTIIASTDAPGAVPGDLGAHSFGAIGKNVNGDTYFGVDGDSTAVYMANTSAVAGFGVAHPATIGEEPATILVAATGVGFDNFNGVAGPGGVVWVAK